MMLSAVRVRGLVGALCLFAGACHADGTPAAISNVGASAGASAAVTVAAPPAPMRTADERLAAWEQHRRMVEDSPFDTFKWQFIGPTNLSGRVTDVEVCTPRGATYTMYAAAASGGVWKSDNEGVTWESIFNDAPTQSIGDIALAPTDQNILWVGTGESNIFRSSMAGCGVYLSNDAGQTFDYMGLGDTNTISRILVHPTDADTVYVAASGAEWTDNEERGVFRTTDGGATWEKILYISPRTGAIDLVMDPEDPDTMYAAMWQRIRLRWNDPRVLDGYDESGIYKTTDGGASWTRLTDGLPAPEVTGRIGLDVARSQPNTIYAFIDNYEIANDDEQGRTDSYGRPIDGTIKGAEVYRSDDRGATWRKVSRTNRYMMRLSATYGWVFGQMRVCPTDPETIYVMGLALNVSRNGGESFERLNGMHGDHHALWIDPENPEFMVNGNDGGICVTYDAGRNWRCFLDNLPAVQFYNVGYDMAEPFRVYGSIQDHGSRRGVVDFSRGRDRIRATEWDYAPGGEASTHVIDPRDPDLVYSAGFYGAIQRSNLATEERLRLVPQAEDGEHPLRGQWLAPFILSPHDPDVVYHGMNFLYKSENRGEDFQRISPDLSHNNIDRIGDIPYQTIFSISESPIQQGLLYVGTDDGRLHRTDDDGGSWTEIVDGLAADRWVSRVIASQYDVDRVYVTQNGKRNDDFAAYLFISEDRGETWVDLAGNIPMGPINVVREDPKNEDIIYVGTDLGVYATLDGGTTWHALCADLPVTYVHDIIIHPRDDIAVVATHGRGMYALDVRPLRMMERMFPEEED